MALPTRNLDDRTFQDIVDEAKKRIAASCPTWTDHNVSDPGITLVELFAWMTEMLIYRLNQVPEKNYIKFMELLGMRLREPEPARTEVSFYFSAPQPQSLTIPAGTEVATVRTETRASVIFSTDDKLVIQPPAMSALLTREMRASGGGKTSYRKHNLHKLGVAGFSTAVFAAKPNIGDALYLGFENDLSYHTLGLTLACPEATGLGIDPTNPPWQWEGWLGGEGDRRWLPAVVEEDGTGGMNQSGRILLRLPQLAQREFRKQRAYWVRCRVAEPAAAGTDYESSPSISDLTVDAWGGSVRATHASVVQHELLGRSDGAPGQVFYVEHTPMLARDAGEQIQVQSPGETAWEPWEETADFADTVATDRCYTCDSATGEIRFGPALRQPDGSVRAYGAMPPRNARVRFSSYRFGGGVAGNVQAHTLSVLKTSIPYIDSVTNHIDATGGIDAEPIELAKMRAPGLLRSRGRAVTPEDYEALVREADSRVQRARCVQPAAGGDSSGPLAGQIYLLLVPRVNRPESLIGEDQLRIDEDMRKKVADYLDHFRLLTVRVDVREPEYFWIEVELSLTANADADAKRVQTDAEGRLYRFLNPIVGGPAGDGWPFGRDLYPSDVYSCLQPVHGIEFIESLKLYRQRPSGERAEITDRLELPAHGLIGSGEHRVTVRGNGR